MQFNKNEQKRLSKNFNSDEFDCKCSNQDCVVQTVDDELITKLQKVRDEYAKPLRVTSAFRCSKHQDSLRGKGIKTAVGQSQHELGRAVDVQPLVSSKAAMDALYDVLEKHFKSIGLARSFFHVDMRDDKEKRRWNY